MYMHDLTGMKRQGYTVVGPYPLLDGCYARVFVIRCKHGTVQHATRRAINDHDLRFCYCKGCKKDRKQGRLDTQGFYERVPHFALMTGNRWFE